MKIVESVLSCKRYVVGITTCVIAASSISISPTVHALATVDVGENQNMNFMILTRTSFKSVEDGAPDGSRSADFTLENARLYMWGQASDDLYWLLDLDRNAGEGTSGEVEILDALGSWEPSNWFNVSAGRVLLPNSHTVLAAPLLSATFDFPVGVWRYPSKFQGRDDGAVVWGGDPEGKFKYRFSTTTGRKDGPNQEDNLLYTGRIEYNFLEAEARPTSDELGYFTFAFQNGAKRIAKVGASVSYQADGAGTQANPGDFTAYNIDARVEWPLADGSIWDLEGGYFHYDLDDVADSSFQTQGDGFYVSGGYLFPGKIGPGRVEPRVVYEYFDGDSSNVADERGEFNKVDAGMMYLLSGHSIRLEAYYTYTEPKVGSSFDTFTTRLYFAW